MIGELNDIEKKIINYLKNRHIGKKNAISYRTLAFYMRLDERELRNIVSHLVSDHYIPIGATSSSGYFYISSQEEYEHVRNELMSRIKALARRARGLRYGWLKEGGGQRNLFEEVV